MVFILLLEITNFVGKMKWLVEFRMKFTSFFKHLYGSSVKQSWS